MGSTLSVLQDYDQQFIQADQTTPPTVDFYRWDNRVFSLLDKTEKLTVLAQFQPQSFALQIWQQLQWLLLQDPSASQDLMWQQYQKLDFIQQNMWYSQLMRASFIGATFNLNLRPYYELLIDNYCQQARQICKIQPLQDEGNQQLAVVLTNQFLTTQHGPTLTVLNYASCLQQLGMQVVVVCTGTVARNYQMFYPMPAPAFFGNVLDEYYQDDVQINLDQRQVWVAPGQGTSVQCWDEQFNFLQLDTNEQPSHLQELADFINQANPRYILCVGGLNPAAEFIGQSRPVLAIPCVTSLQLPKYMVPVVLRDLSETEHQSIANLHLQHPVFCSQLPFRLRPSSAVKTSSVQDAAILFGICGYRLEHELSADFYQTLRRLKQSLPGAAFVLIGAQKYPDYPEDLLPCTEFTGQILNAIELIGQCHFLLNPRRQGGGTSAVEALSLGIPVLTEPYGDTYQYVGDDFAFTTDEDRLLFITSYLSSPPLQQEYTEKCLSRAAMVTDTRHIFQPLLLDYDSYLYQLLHDDRMSVA
jgi:glycosyltransferase involved in cell wall biosynthesis